MAPSPTGGASMIVVSISKIVKVGHSNFTCLSTQLIQNPDRVQNSEHGRVRMLLAVVALAVTGSQSWLSRNRYLP